MTLRYVSSRFLLRNSPRCLLKKSTNMLQPERSFSTPISTGFEGVQQLLQRNKNWAKDIQQKDPHFFESLSQQQTPEILWIGCSDSRVPANQILSLPPGEVFVHRNIANQVVHTDMNCLSVLEYAVMQLKVKHIIVCGHYGCGGIKAALTQQEYGLVDNWLRNIKDLFRENNQKFLHVKNETARSDLLTELNVARSVYNVCHTRIVQSAWDSGHQLSVHGWCYRLKDGIIRDLHINITGQDQVEEIYRRIACKKDVEK